uniref:Secreted protein n=1 Tax=Panagrellus redivivus TaxID=6233 RepID=A0A7E4WC86_PANRE
MNSKNFLAIVLVLCCILAFMVNVNLAGAYSISMYNVHTDPRTDFNYKRDEDILSFHTNYKEPVTFQ